MPHAKQNHRARKILLTCAAVVLATWTGVATIRAQAPPEPSTPAKRDRNAERGGRDRSAMARLREGTHIADRPGRFYLEGDSATFVTNDGYRMGGLPNLGLERVVRTLKTAGQPERVQWSVSGTVTEFSGSNYLLIDRAVCKAMRPVEAE